MNLHSQIQHQRRLLRRHGSGYICARLAPLFVLAACLFVAYLSLRQAHELFLGSLPLSSEGLRGNQTSLLLQHTLLGVVAAALARLTYDLWRLDVWAWWVAQALGVALLAVLMVSGAGLARLGLCGLFLLLLNNAQRTFALDTPQP